MSFSENVRREMERRLIGQNELAKKAGLSSSGISTALREDGNPRLSTVISIAATLGCSVADLLEGVQDGRDYLAADEIKLIQIYRQLNEDGKAFLIQDAQNYFSRSAFRQKNGIASAV